MLKVDRLTSIHSRGQYARICVEIDLEKPLKSFILIRGHKLFLEYEGLHLICFQYGKYGHKANQCGSSSSIVQKEGQNSILPNKNLPHSQPFVEGPIKNLA